MRDTGGSCVNDCMRDTGDSFDDGCTRDPVSSGNANIFNLSGVVVVDLHASLSLKELCNIF